MNLIVSGHFSTSLTVYSFHRSSEHGSRSPVCTKRLSMIWESMERVCCSSTIPQRILRSPPLEGGDPSTARPHLLLSPNCSALHLSCRCLPIWPRTRALLFRLSMEY